MAFVAVDKDGTELIYELCPKRYEMCWQLYRSECVELPKGSIEKLIGRKLTWEDDPVKLENYGKESN